MKNNQTIYQKQKTSPLFSNVPLVLVFVIFGLFNYTNLSAQPETITADRPGAAEGTHAVTPGIFYIELGYQYSFRDNFKMSSVPDVNFRFGLVDRVEMFIMWDGVNILHDIDDTELELPGIGGKYRLVMADEFNLTLLGAVEFSDDDGFSAEPLLALAWDYELSDNLELFGTGLTQYDGDDFEFLFVLGLEVEATDKIGVFAEYYFTDMGTDKLFHGSEYGIMYLLTDDIQIDVYGGYGFSEEIAHYLGFGVSKRF